MSHGLVYEQYVSGSSDVLTYLIEKVSPNIPGKYEFLLFMECCRNSNNYKECGHFKLELWHIQSVCTKCEVGMAQALQTKNNGCAILDQ